MSTEELSESERDLLDVVPEALASGVELLEWWQEADAAHQEDGSAGYEHSYTETAVANRPEDTSYGFFDKVELSSAGEVPINGNVQEMFYDEPKTPADYKGNVGEWMNQQVREFILRYFMRISDFRQPEPVAEEHPAAPPGLGFLSQFPKQAKDITGFGFSQLLYKRQGSDTAEKFSEAEGDKIVDLRRFAEELDWMVLKNPIFSFGFDAKPLGASGPHIRIPAKVFNYLVLSSDFVVHEENPEPGVLGRYGFGYAFVNDPEPSLYGYGPGRLQPAFEQLVWEVSDSGEVTVRATFVAREPKSILELSVDPLAWGFQITKALGAQVPELLRPVKKLYDRLPLTNITFDPVLPTLRLLNLATAGQAGERLGISKTQVVKEALFLHFLQHYNTIVGSLQTWRQVPDWTADEKDLPGFVVSGVSS